MCVDTTLDYGCEWTLVMEKHLVSRPPSREAEEEPCHGAMKIARARA